MCHIYERTTHMYLNRQTLSEHFMSAINVNPVERLCKVAISFLTNPASEFQEFVVVGELSRSRLLVHLSMRVFNCPCF